MLNDFYSCGKIEKIVCEKFAKIKAKKLFCYNRSKATIITKISKIPR